MPYVSDNNCPPVDDTIPLWRYMTTAKFLSLLLTRSAFFCRLDLLGDPFEGVWPVANRIARDEWIAQTGKPLTPKAAELLSKSLHDLRREAAAWCWQQSEVESYSMWQSYVGKGTDGIAICSTPAAVRDCVAAAPQLVMLGAVQYIDHQRDVIDTPGGINVIPPLFRKRRLYDAEREVRALVWYPGEETLSKEAAAAGGLTVPVYLPTLVKSVHLAPDSPPWYRKLIEEVVRRVDPDVEVLPSALDAMPTY